MLCYPWRQRLQVPVFLLSFLTYCNLSFQNHCIIYFCMNVPAKQIGNFTKFKISKHHPLFSKLNVWGETYLPVLCCALAFPIAVWFEKPTWHFYNALNTMATFHSRNSRVANRDKLTCFPLRHNKCLPSFICKPCHTHKHARKYTMNFLLTFGSCCSVCDLLNLSLKLTHVYPSIS